MSTAQTAVTRHIRISPTTNLAYRLLNPSASLNASNHPPLILHNHFRSNMDHWDPLLLNALAKTRTLLIFDPTGVARSTGAVPLTIQGWANDVLALVDALSVERPSGIAFEKVDVLGFSMGGYAAQMIALSAPGRVRKLVLAGTGPSGPPEGFDGVGAGIVWPREEPPGEPLRLLATAVAEGEVREAIECSFFNGEKGANEAYWGRVEERRHGVSELVVLELLDKNEGGRRQLQAARAFRPAGPGGSFERLGELKMPVLVVNGDDDWLIPTSRSWELLRGIGHAKLILYPKSGHGFLSKYAEAVARDINAFLDDSVVVSKL